MTQPRDGQGGEGGPSRPYWVWLLVLAAIPILILFRQGSTVTHFSQREFLRQLQSSNVVSGTIVYDTQSPSFPLHEISGKYLTTEQGRRVKRRFTTRVDLTDELESQLLDIGSFEAKSPNTGLRRLLRLK